MIRDRLSDTKDQQRLHELFFKALTLTPSASFIKSLDVCIAVWFTYIVEQF